MVIPTAISLCVSERGIIRGERVQCHCNPLRANLFKNQADLYWRVIYDPEIFFGGRPKGR